MIGSIIGGALKIGSAIYGGRQAAKAAREKEKNLQNQIQQNEDWYNRRYNEDATQRADAQRLITLTEEALKKRNKAAQGTAAVMGSSTEAVAAEKAASAQALADVTGQIAANNEARKDKIEQQYQENERVLNSQLNDFSTNKANAISQAVGTAGEVAGGIADAFNTDTLDEQIAQADENQKIPFIKYD